MENRKLIADQRFGEERALYAINNAQIVNCAFAGQEDGESALKEARNLEINNCDFLLRYPLWRQRLRTWLGNPGDMERVRGRMRLWDRKQK